MSSPTPGHCAADYSTRRTIFNSNATPQKMLSSDPSRVLLCLSDQAGNIWFGDSTITNAGGGHIFISTSAPFLIMPWVWWGPAIQEEWWSVRVSGTSKTSIYEVFYRPGAR